MQIFDVDFSQHPNFVSTFGSGKGFRKLDFELTINEANEMRGIITGFVMFYSWQKSTPAGDFFTLKSEVSLISANKVNVEVSVDGGTTYTNLKGYVVVCSRTGTF